jgi:hypothetical protein
VKRKATLERGPKDTVAGDRREAAEEGQLYKARKGAAAFFFLVTQPPVSFLESYCCLRPIISGSVESSPCLSPQVYVYPGRPLPSPLSLSLPQFFGFTYLPRYTAGLVLSPFSRLRRSLERPPGFVFSLFFDLR